MESTLRTMLPEDWPQIARIYQLGLDSGIASFETQAPDWETWDNSHLDLCRIVAEKEGKIQGWVALSPVSTRWVYRGVAEVSIYIDPQLKGEGIGSRLMKALIEESEAAGFWTLQSGIFRQNAASIRLHEKMGFRQIGFREKVGKRGEQWYDNVLMERRSQKTGVD